MEYPAIDPLKSPKKDPYVSSTMDAPSNRKINNPMDNTEATTFLGRTEQEALISRSMPGLDCAIRQNIPESVCDPADSEQERIQQNESEDQEDHEVQRRIPNLLPVLQIEPVQGCNLDRGRSASVPLPVDHNRPAVDFAEIGRTLRRLSDQFGRRLQLRRSVVREKSFRSRCHSHGNLNRDL